MMPGIESTLEVVKLATKIANPDLVIAATKANVEALELSKKNFELQSQVNALEAKITELVEKLKLSGEVFTNGSFAYREGDPASFCSRCWDVDRRLVHIIMFNQGKGLGMGPGCPECKTFTHGRGRNPRMSTGVGE